MSRIHRDADISTTAAWISLALIVVVLSLVIASTWRVYINTWDEPEHLAAGLELIETGHYRYDIQHPPLARVAIAVGPWLLGAKSLGMEPPDGKPEGLAILYGEGHYWQRLSAARAGTLPFFALLVFATYLWSRTVQSRLMSVLSAALVGTVPAIVGHAGLATIDVAATATLLAMLYVWLQFFRTPTLWWAIGVGLVSGIALGVKLSAIPFGLLGILVLWAWRRRAFHAPRLAWWRSGVNAGVVVLLVGAVLTLAYGGGWETLTGPEHKFNQALFFLFGKSGRWHDWGYDAFSHFQVPVAFQWYLGGIQALTVHNQTGHLSYLLGQTRLTGWWYFYLVALAVKTPLPLLVTGVTGMGLMVWEGRRLARWSLCVMPSIAVVILTFASVYSNINIGVRHVLVIYPFLCIGAAFAINRLSVAIQSASGWRKMGGVVLVGALLTNPIWVLIHEWPDYLPYFNATVADPEQVLVDSDLDWGQDLARLSLRLAELRVPEISIAYSGSAVMAYEHLPPYHLLAPDQRAVGWVAVSALARVDAPHRFDWLNAYHPLERVGKTIDLYFIPSLQER